MTALELKTEIHQEIDNLPESILPQILDFIHSIKQSSPEIDMKKHIDLIFDEDDELLRRLAQ